MAIDLKPEEVSSILKSQLADFEMKSETYEVGTVLSVGDGIARVHGLANVMAETYRTGKGGFRLRSKWEIEDLGRGTWQIIVTEIPYPRAAILPGSPLRSRRRARLVPPIAIPFHRA